MQTATQLISDLETAHPIPSATGKPGKKNFLCLETLTRQELDAALEKGYNQMREGRAQPAEEVFAGLRSDLAL